MKLLKTKKQAFVAIGALMFLCIAYYGLVTTFFETLETCTIAEYTNPDGTTGTTCACSQSWQRRGKAK
jgi:hypothetical protein